MTKKDERTQQRDVSPPETRSSTKQGEPAPAGSESMLEPNVGAGMNQLAKLLSMLGAESHEATHAVKKEHKFWNTQPVKQLGDHEAASTGAIEPNVPPELVRTKPLPLPADFEWVTIDMEDDAQLSEVYHLLTHHYVEDGEATMRFKYSPAFLRWVLHHPGYDKSWHIGVRVKSSQKLVAFIAGIPQELRIHDSVLQVTEINFLCVHKLLRSKRLAPVLIKEVTRRCHKSGIFQAIYTAGQVLPTPISCARYYHRTLHARKLVEVGFSSVPRGMSMAQHEARYKLPETTSLPGLRPMQTRDVPAVGRLLRRYMARFDMAPRFSDAEVRHLFAQAVPLDTRPVTWAYVVERHDGAITDFFSFYSLPSTLLGHEQYDTLEAAYLFYYATDAAFDDGAAQQSASTPTPPPAQQATDQTISPYEAARQRGQAAWQCSALSRLSPTEAADEADVRPWHTESHASRERLKARLCALMNDMLVLANKEGFDVVNCLTVLDNPLFTHELKFGPGDGFLRFYLFNWRIAPIAGGMGSRADEDALDPAAVSSEENEHVPRPLPPSIYGSGNGIVMV